MSSSYDPQQEAIWCIGFAIQFQNVITDVLVPCMSLRSLQLNGQAYSLKFDKFQPHEDIFNNNTENKNNEYGCQKWTTEEK